MEIDKLISLAQHYMTTNNLDHAETFLKKAISIDENNSLANEIIGQIYFHKNQLNGAIHHLKKACNSNKCSHQSFYLLGSALLQIGQAKEAIGYFESLIKENVRSFEVLHDLATCFAKIGEFDSSLSLYKECISLDPNSPHLHYNIGRLYDELGNYQNALNSYDTTIRLDSSFSYAYANKAADFDELKKYDQAVIFFNQALKINPNLDWVAGDLLHIKMKICSWSCLAESMEDISKKVMAKEKVASPFSLLALNDDALLHKKSAEIYASNKYPKNLALGLIPMRQPQEKIRIGYFSGDFSNHPVSYLTAELYELHDRNKFEIIAFSFGVDDKSEIRSRLSKAFDRFIDVNSVSDFEIAKLARELQIDIAVDLGGHTKDSRTGIFSYRAAPVQISYIGYLGTMGAEYYDYLLADKTIIPDELQKFYSEKIAYLPSYQVNDRKRIISEKRFTRAEFGLPDVGFIFCCFNNNYKILPATFDSWIRILNAVEGSVLFLYVENEWAKANLINEAALRGVNSSRLVFGGRIPVEEYLARYLVCDLFLDTFPYNAGTTASDALWAGLPVITLMGRSFASRVAASLLNAIGLPELITTTKEEYEALVIELASNPQKFEDIKLRLAHNRLTTPLFDSPLFTKNLEAAYIEMYERYLADLALEHIQIT